MYDKKISFEQLCADFNWDKELDVFSTNVSKGFVFGYEICDRYSGSDKIAIFWEGVDGKERAITFSELSELSDKFALCLKEAGLKTGDRVATLLPRVPELYIALLAIWKAGGVYVPLFTAFGPEAIRYRLEHSETRFLVTHGQFRKNVPEGIKGLEKVFVVKVGDETLAENDVDFQEGLNVSTGKPEEIKVNPDDLAIILYTSGSTGMPKGAMLSYKFFIYHVPYVRYAVWLKPEDRFWCPADPAWAYGLLQAFAPLLLGNSILVYEGLFSPEICYKLLEKYKITNMAYAPTAFRALAAAGDELRKKYKINLRAISSAGEPLTADTVRWAINNFGTAIYDHYGFTEGGMLVNNYNCCDMEIKPGSMGFPVPWHRVALVDKDGNETDGSEPSIIAIDRNQYGFYFKGYWKEEEKTKDAYKENWFISGDLARKDKEGYFWFEGRYDDVITSAGYRIGPFEIENTLVEHEAVAEAAVVGKPDPIKGEIVKAYVVLKPTYRPTLELGEEIKLFVKQRLSKHQYPREIEFIEVLPKTESGKIQRFKLRERSI